MTLKSHFTFASDFANSATIYLQADGVEKTNQENPNGLFDNLIIENGVLLSKMRDTDELTYSGHRADISWQSDAKGEFWYTWRVMIPDSWGSYDKRLVIAQIHDRPDGGDGAQYPNLLLMVDNKEFSTTVPTGIHPTPVNAGKPMGGVPMAFNRWYECCLHANWQTSNGFREFFIDRKPIFREFGVPTEYDNVLGPYLKLGLYDNYHWGDFDEKSVYFSDAKVWSGLESYQTVMGGVPILAARLIG